MAGSRSAPRLPDSGRTRTPWSVADDAPPRRSAVTFDAAFGSLPVSARSDQPACRSARPRICLRPISGTPRSRRLP
jgi:hypothetical protein